MCVPLLLLAMVPAVRGFDTIFQQKLPKTAVLLLPIDPVSFELSVFTVRPGLAQSSIFDPSSQQAEVAPHHISWNTNPDVWAWCQDIFSQGKDTQYNVQTKMYELYYMGLFMFLPVFNRFDQVGGINQPWRNIRKCNKPPECTGCFHDPLVYFAYRLYFKGDNNVLAYGRCQGYIQYGCEARATCANGESVSNFKSLDPYSNLDIFKAVCQTCPRGTWNTCTEKIQSPYTTCTWNIPDFNSFRPDRVGTIWIVEARLPSMCAHRLNDSRNRY